MIKKIIIYLSICVQFCSFAEETFVKVRFCSDENTQVPFIFKHNNKVVGVYPDIFSIVKEKLASKVRVEFEYNFYPWERCLLELKHGEVDAALTASYNKERAEFLNYPADEDHATEPCKSKLKINCNEHLVLTYKSNNFIYDGDPKHLPNPVRATRGYSVVNDLKKLGIKVEVAKGEENILLQLLRDKEGCAIVTGVIARELIKKRIFGEKLFIQLKPFIKKSYYIPFSKKSHVNIGLQKQIWEEMAKVLSHEKLIQQIYEKYTEE